jgi:hypothetical protein
MHPEISLYLAKGRIADLHREAAQERLFRQIRAEAEPVRRPRISLGLGLARLFRQPAGA